MIASTTLRSWKWEFYTINNNTAHCNICDMQIDLQLDIQTAVKHFQGQHNKTYLNYWTAKAKEDLRELSEEKSWTLVHDLYIRTENGDLQCTRCNLILLGKKHENKIVQHLSCIHRINEAFKRRLEDWLKDWTHIPENDKLCYLCNINFAKINLLVN